MSFRYQYPMQRGTREALAEAIGEALEAVGVCEAQGFITHRSYCRLEELLREALNRVRPSALYSTLLVKSAQAWQVLLPLLATIAMLKTSQYHRWR